MKIVRNGLFLLAIFQIVISQDLGDLYREYMKRNDVISKYQTQTLPRALENVSRIHPDLIYYNLEFFNATVGSPDPVKVRIQLKTLNWAKNDYLLRRSIWASAQQQDLKNQRLTHFMSRYIYNNFQRLKVSEKIKNTISLEDSIVVDSNLVDFFACLLYTGDNTQKYSSGQSYAIQRKVIETKRLERYKTIFRKVSEDPKESKLSYVDSLMYDWHLLEKNSSIDDCISPVQFMTNICNSYWLPVTYPKLSISASVGYQMTNRYSWTIPIQEEIDVGTYSPKVTCNFPLMVASILWTYRYNLKPRGHFLAFIDISCGYAHNLNTSIIRRQIQTKEKIRSFQSNDVPFENHESGYFQSFKISGVNQIVHGDLVAPIMYLSNIFDAETGVAMDFVFSNLAIDYLYRYNIEYYIWGHIVNANEVIHEDSQSESNFNKFYISPILRMNLRLSKNLSFNFQTTLYRQDIAVRWGM